MILDPCPTCKTPLPLTETPLSPSNCPGCGMVYSTLESPGDLDPSASLREASPQGTQELQARTPEFKNTRWSVESFRVGDREYVTPHPPIPEDMK
jgi:hypothetical protein